MSARTNAKQGEAASRPGRPILARPAQQGPCPGRPGRPSVELTLEELIRSLQQCTDNDDFVVAVVYDLIRRGRLRAPQRPWLRQRRTAA